MGKKRQTEVGAEEKKQAAVEDDGGAEQAELSEKKRRKKERKEKRRSSASHGVEGGEEEQPQVGAEVEAEAKAAAAEEAEAKPAQEKKQRTKKGKKSEEGAEAGKEEVAADADDRNSRGDVDRPQQSSGQAEDDEDTFDLSSLKKANKSSSSASPPPTSSSSSSSPPSSTADGTRVFLGNLSFKVTDDAIISHFSACGPLVGLHYVTDKATGKFYGSAFLDFDSPEAAVAALSLNGSSLLDRPLKVGMATGTHAQGLNRFNSKGKGGHIAAAPVSDKPEGTTTVFLGNLSFDITEGEVKRLFEGCGTVREVRWVEKDGVFKGCGFVDFDSSDATDAAVKLNGSSVLGRPMRVDYSAASSNQREREEGAGEAAIGMYNGRLD